jgi:PEP-CTERM motif
MNRMFRVVCVHPTYIVALLLIAAPASRAAVFERDWKSPGDGLLTYDDVNQREWLDLTETQLFKFPGITLEDRYQAVLSETMPGGQFAGFMAASNPSDIRLLGESAGIDTSTLGNPINGIPATNLINLLGVSIAGNFPESLGMLNGIDGRTGERGNMRVLNDGQNAGMLFGLGVDSRAGVWMYRQVPEPSAFLLFGLGFVGLFIRCRRYRKVVS